MPGNHERRYYGPRDPYSFSRAFRTCENLWNSERNIQVGSFDRLIANQLTKRLNPQFTSKQVTALDFGSGDATLFMTFLTSLFDQTDQDASLTRNLLANNPQLSLRFIGLTDADNTSQFSREDLLPNQSTVAWENQIQAENISFTISQENPLTEFLQAVGIDNSTDNGVDLITATASLLYLDGQMFENTVNESINAMAHGGKMVAVAFSPYEPRNLGLMQDPVLTEVNEKYFATTQQQAQALISHPGRKSSRAERFGQTSSLLKEELTQAVGEIYQRVTQAAPSGLNLFPITQDVFLSLSNLNQQLQGEYLDNFYNFNNEQILRFLLRQIDYLRNVLYRVRLLEIRKEKEGFIDSLKSNTNLQVQRAEIPVVVSRSADSAVDIFVIDKKINL